MRGRVRRVADDHGQRLGDRMHHGPFEGTEIVLVRRRRQSPDDAAGHQESEAVDRVARVGTEHHVAWRGDRLGHVGEAFLRADGDDHLAVGIDLHPEAAAVIGRLGAAKPADSARGGIAVGVLAPGRLGQLLDDMRRSRQIGVAHPEVDDIGAPGPCPGLQPVDLLEDIRRQPPHAVEFVHGARPVHRQSAGAHSG